MSFEVFYKNGCSIEEYFQQIGDIKCIHVHFILKKFVHLCLYSGGTHQKTAV